MTNECHVLTLLHIMTLALMPFTQARQQVKWIVQIIVPMTWGPIGQACFFSLNADAMITIAHTINSFGYTGRIAPGRQSFTETISNRLFL